MRQRLGKDWEKIGRRLGQDWAKIGKRWGKDREKIRHRLGIDRAKIGPIGCDVLETSDHFVPVPTCLITCLLSLVPLITCPHFCAISGFLLLLATNTNNYLLYAMIMSQYLSLKLIFLLSCLVKLTRLRSYT